MRIKYELHHIPEEERVLNKFKSIHHKISYIIEFHCVAIVISLKKSQNYLSMKKSWFELLSW